VTFDATRTTVHSRKIAPIPQARPVKSVKAS
jgi:hypothetical protein